MSTTTESAALKTLRHLESTAAELFAASQDALHVWGAAGAKTSGPEFEAQTAAMEKYHAAAYRVEEQRRELGMDRPVLPRISAANNAAEQLTDGFRALNGQMGPTGGFTVKGNLIELALGQPAGFRAALDGGSLGAKGRPVEFLSDLPAREPSVLDLIPLVRTLDELGGTVIEYFKVGSRSNDAAVVAALAEKPQSEVSISRESTTLRKWAHISEAVALEFLVGQSGDMLRSFLEVDMARGVMRAFEADCISGAGSTTVDGVTHVSGTLTQAATGSPIEDIRKAHTQLQLAHIRPDALVLHPTDAETIDLQTDGDGLYYLGGPLGADSERMWRTPVVLSTGLTQGTAVLGNWREGMARWAGISAVEWVRLTDDAKYNQYRLIAEAGAAAAVIRPGNFVKITIS